MLAAIVELFRILFSGSLFEGFKFFGAFLIYLGFRIFGHKRPYKIVMQQHSLLSYVVGIIGLLAVLIAITDLIYRLNPSA